MFGTNITAPGDPLQKVPVDYFYNSLLHPKPANEALIRQLRIVYQLDSKQYAEAKKKLPYIVCGIFSPATRKKIHFAYIDRFIVDIDKLTAKGMDIRQVRQTLQADPRVMMCFLSPSEDGLKVMFRLKERCYDAGLYSSFYKEFLTRLSAQYNLEQVVDKVTSDVSRACFISVDHEAYYNPQCEPIDLFCFVDEDLPFDVSQTKKNEKDGNPSNTNSETKEKKGPREPEADIMDEIKKRLGVKPRDPALKQVYVPEELQNIMDDLKTFIEQAGLYVKEVRNIQYGKKISAQLGLKKAEVNLFYGKHGFSAVISPKCGTDDALNSLLRDIIIQFLNR